VLEVRVRPGVALATALHPFEQSGGRWDRPSPPTSVRNLERISWLPWALATAVAALALGALAHALAMSVRSNRRELAVVRSLGFTPRQVRRAAGWEAVVLALAALILGVPLGLLLGTSGWGVLMRGIGLRDGAAVPVVVIPLMLVGVVGLAVVSSAWPGWRAARARPASALRSE
jgi:ABC-type lipoprotein release transport system permease subunit